jgi:hypothetical protein
MTDVPGRTLTVIRSRPSATDALDMKEAMTQRDVAEPVNRRIPFRMGMKLGEIVTRRRVADSPQRGRPT